MFDYIPFPVFNRHLLLKLLNQYDEVLMVGYFGTVVVGADSSFLERCQCSGGVCCLPSFPGFVVFIVLWIVSVPLSWHGPLLVFSLLCVLFSSPLFCITSQCPSLAYGEILRRRRPIPVDYWYLPTSVRITTPHVMVVAWDLGFSQECLW